MRSLIVLLAVLAVPFNGLSKTINVPGDYNTIQEAIEASSGGDTVLVHPGTYVEKINFKGKAILVTSAGGPEVTVIDGNRVGRVVVFRNGEGSDSVLDGFTVTNGKSMTGSGIYCLDASPIIQGNVVSHNSDGWHGAGIYCEGSSSPLITGNTICWNKAKYVGGGIYCDRDSLPTIENNFIEYNVTETGGYPHGGGGIYCGSYSGPVIRFNILRHNKSFYGYGGGICCPSMNAPVIEGNIIAGNSAGFGGGIFLYYASGRIAHNRITGNDAVHCGGGISFRKSSPAIEGNIIDGNTADGGGGIHCDLSSPVLTNNIITGNGAYLRGGGLYCNESQLSIESSTLSGNKWSYHGGGLYIGYSAATITNAILWNNDAGTGPEIYFINESMQDPLTISYSDVDGGKDSVHVEPDSILIWGPGMIVSDPLFVDAAEKDYHLTFNSPCRGSGSNSTPGLPDADFEGDPRVAYGTVDMGADEYHPHLYWTGEATPGGTVELKFVGLPGTAHAGLCIGSGVLDPPIPSMWGDWYLQFPVIGPVDLGGIPSPDGVLIVPFIIPGSPPPPYSIPMQALIGDGLTNLSVLAVE